jgi:hypothetical protein
VFCGAWVKKTVMALVFVSIFVFLAIAGTDLANIVGANPVPYPPTPNEELPTLVIYAPETYSVSDGKYSLDFHFTMLNPEAWDVYHMGFFPYVGRCSVSVYLDGAWKKDYEGTSAPVNNYTVVFSNLTSDQHTVEINLHAMTFSEIGTFRSELTQKAFFKINPASHTISFREDPITITRGEYPSPSPTASPKPTLTPESTPEQTPLPTINTGPSPYYFDDFLVGGIASAVAVAVLVLLFYFIRRK